MGVKTEQSISKEKAAIKNFKVRQREMPIIAITEARSQAKEWYLNPTSRVLLLFLVIGIKVSRILQKYFYTREIYIKIVFI